VINPMRTLFESLMCVTRVIQNKSFHFFGVFLANQEVQRLDRENISCYYLMRFSKKFLSRITTMEQKSLYKIHHTDFDFVIFLITARNCHEER